MCLQRSISGMSVCTVVAIELAGRTLRPRQPAPTVVSGALVRIDGYWPTFPPPNVTPSAVMVAPDLVNIAPGFMPRAAPRLAHSASGRWHSWRVPTRSCCSPQVNGTCGCDCLIVNRSAPAHCSSSTTRNGARREYILVDQVDTTSSADQPAWVTLEYPLAHTHLEHAVCRVATLPAAGPVNGLVRDAIPGDETAFTNALAGVNTGDIVEIDDAAGPPSITRRPCIARRAMSTATSACRRFARVAMVLLHAERLGPYTSGRRDGQPRVSSGREPHHGDVPHDPQQLCVCRRALCLSTFAPGVYVEEIQTGNKPIEGVSTSTTGAVGVTERGPINVPQLVTSYGE
jgi:hypothetical protein